MDYKTSGVDIKVGREFVSEIKVAVEKTHSRNVINSIGGFAGLFRLPLNQFKNPILVSGTDGVGTKLELAQVNNFHFEVGIDLVAMCINDIVTTGASPLFFLDYIATGKLDKDQLKNVILGIAKSCKENNCCLLGGETAEMPGFYSPNKYDLAGFCVGVVEEDKLINGENIQANDLIIAIESSGIHSNGFSLVRNVIKNVENIEDKFEKMTNLNFYNELLKPTIIYSNLIRKLLLENIEIKGMAHITGGGIPENLPRCMPKKFIPHIYRDSWEVPSIFRFFQELGQIPENDFWNTFNLGVGYCLVIDEKYKDKVFNICESQGLLSWEIGKILNKNESNANRFFNGISI
tara:strand:+ start:846 stop:1889 length:1044 start_codon:yes stop_codon:yes gene_type:complete